MRLTFAAVLLPLILSSCADGTATTHASDRGAASSQPTIVIGPCRPASFEGDTEVFAWPITGTLRGSLQAKLWRFADGKEELLAEARLDTDEMDVTGQLLVLLRDGAPFDRTGERVVEIRMPMAATPQAKVAGTPSTMRVEPTGAHAPRSTPDTLMRVEPTGVHALPSTPNHGKGLGGGGTMVCLPNHYNTMEMWSQTHAVAPATLSFMSPWHFQRNMLLQQCVNGVVTMVVTLEQQLADEAEFVSPR
ncbi:MAG: hypothetical protein MUC36_14575 [Planctomycetes bacterium]|jgi:hypothetical protein|nr:hypothetical protein [Planctomycetota bacterium]